MYSEALAHQLYAASDMVLVPSMFEPCGLTQVGDCRLWTKLTPEPKLYQGHCLSWPCNMSYTTTNMAMAQALYAVEACGDCDTKPALLTYKPVRYQAHSM